MILVLKPGASGQQTEELLNQIKAKGFDVHISVGHDTTIIGLIGDTTKIDRRTFSSFDIVLNILKVTEPFKKANRMFHPEDTVIDVGGKKVGNNTFSIIAGPCSVESESQIVEIAKELKKSGVTFLRGGAYKPRTSPYSFQGLGLEGLDLLKIAREETGLPIVSEIMSTDVLDRFVEDVDIIQIGARNMQNFVLLKELGRTTKPILLKRGLSATLEEWLMSAEYIMSEGNENIILCERGIRTFETYTRNTLDLSAVPAIKKLSHLPIIVDPSHGTGKSWMVETMSKAALVSGADGVVIEVHHNPKCALSDGEQSITPDEYSEIIPKLNKLADIEEKKLEV
ncbi:MAG: 3-deoxy-7-phosphoheptulonate synthase [Acetivibrionales bacterium]|jgi:3-deoxy-7-phosphoheptulonate synthase|nr:3-deoxy-7-phosphoheptulonate synthase [Clostridiaceae bacterium]